MKGVNAIGLLDFTDFGKWLSTWGGYAGAIVVTNVAAVFSGLPQFGCDAG